jgi:predicted Ser/Thr protein kinase
VPYANAAERLLAAIGEPQMIDTAKDPRLGRIFLNRTMRAYPAFAGFYGMEETIERIVGFFRTPRRASKSASRSSICSARSAAANPRSPSG